MFDDLLGDTEEPLDPPYGEDFKLKISEVHEVDRGVTIRWLCAAFTMSRNQVIAKLAGCPSIRLAQNGGKVYELRVAASYLVKPQINIREYIEKLDPKDLPERLKREFWSSRITEQRFRREAGDLWRSEDVIALYGELFKLIKSKTQLWADSVENVEALTEPQREMLVELVDDLISNIYKTVEELETGRMTASSIAEADDDESEE